MLDRKEAMLLRRAAYIEMVKDGVAIIEVAMEKAGISSDTQGPSLLGVCLEIAVTLLVRKQGLATAPALITESATAALEAIEAKIDAWKRRN